MFYKLKEYNQLTPLINGTIVQNKVIVNNNELFIITNNETYKLSNNKWYVKTELTNNNYLYLGVGALPNCILEINQDEVVSQAEFELLFEEATQENENY